MAIPRLCCSHTVTGTASFVYAYSGNHTVSLTAGTYWTDPIYSGGGLSTCDLLQAVATLISAGGASSSSYNLNTALGYAAATISTADDTQILAGNAAVTAAGRHALVRLGYPATSSSPPSAGPDIDAGTMGGFWQPTYCETSSLIENDAGESGAVVVSADGSAYTTYTGDPERGRLLVVQACSGANTHPSTRSTFASVGQDVSFKTLIWKWLVRGEKVRYYANTSATYTYVTSAVTATDASIVLKSNTGVTAYSSLIVDGETMYATANTSGTTWSVDRHDPVSHAQYAPVGVNAFVGTYVLGNDGGNVNRGQFAPQRRAANQDRWDMEIALVRATA